MEQETEAGRMMLESKGIVEEAAVGAQPRQEEEEEREDNGQV